MAKRKHAEMIKAWADNDELVVFVREGDAGWRICALPIWNSFAEYFPCLPQHKEACLHWLNGGEVEYKENNSWELAEGYLDDPTWYANDDFMGEDWEFRIKPKKEKRWIIAAYMKYFDSKEAAESACYIGGQQPIEIEIEV